MRLDYTKLQKAFDALWQFTMMSALIGINILMWVALFRLVF